MKAKSPFRENFSSRIYEPVMKRHFSVNMMEHCIIHVYRWKGKYFGQAPVSYPYSIILINLRPILGPRTSKIHKSAAMSPPWWHFSPLYFHKKIFFWCLHQDMQTGQVFWLPWWSTILCIWSHYSLPSLPPSSQTTTSSTSNIVILSYWPLSSSSYWFYPHIWSSANVVDKLLQANLPIPAMDNV